jgi:threonyl-tRNA synthetase
MIYPYTHLSSGIASPEASLAVLKSLERELLENDLEVTRAAFGWYKEFEMKSKGHPLADLSMTICPYEGRNCDCHCPYCKRPLKKEELK